MKRPTISVVLCTYNGEKYVAQQIDSIINQSIIPDEFIISDDCSTDATVDLLSDFAKNYPATVRLFQNVNNLGFIKNFEKAIGLAEGEVIFLSDQDDTWFEHKIERMLQPFMDKQDIGLVYSDAVVTNSHLEPTRATLFGRRKHLMLSKERSAPMLARGVGINGCTMAFRSPLQEIILPICTGWGHDHWIAFIAYATMAVTPIPEALMYYRRHGSSAGYDPILEGGRLQVWQAGLSSASLDVYERDFCRWENMLNRLLEIRGKRSVPWVDSNRLNIFLWECKRRVKLARMRCELKHKRRRSRVADVSHILLCGYYHRYLNGIKSLAKDLLVR